MAAVLSVVIIAGITVGQVAFFVATIALSYVISSLNQPDGLRGSSQTDPGVRAQVPPDTTNPLPVAYGSAYLGGRFVDACLRLDQKVMYYVHAISCISQNGDFVFDTSEFYYGDRKVTFALDVPNKVYSLTDGAGNVDTSIDNHLYITLYKSDKDGNITPLNGTLQPWEYQATSDGTSALMGIDSGLPEDQKWIPTVGPVGRKMNGLAFAIIRLSYSRDAGTTQLQPITYRCHHYLSTFGHVRPGEAWVDYMTNPIYGCAIPEEFIDIDSADALDAYSDELITFTDYNGNPQTQPRYRVNGVIDTNKNVLKNIDDIMTAGDSWMAYNAESGLWSITINQAGSPVLALDDNNIIGSINVGTVDLAQSINVVEAKFPDGTNRDQYNYASKSVPADLLYPNEPVNKQTLTYELVNDSVQALYLANRVLEQGREDLTVTINTTYEGIQLSAGDIVSVTNGPYGWSAKLFRCMQIREALIDNSLGAQLQLIEYNDQVYDNFDITQYTPAPNTGTPSAGYFSALNAPTVTDPQPYAVLPSFDVNCITPATGRVTSVILFYTTSATPTDADWNVFGSQTLPSSAVIDPVSTITFANIYLAKGTYYFAFKVGNNAYLSTLSPLSLPFVWSPDPTSIRTFTTTFVPSIIQVPFDGTTADFTDVTFQLYGANGLGPVDFSMAQSDSDVTFTNNSWRIGGSDTTGFGDIVKSNITVGNPTDGGTYAQFPQPTAMSADTATVYVPVRYKDGDGDISQATPASIQITYAKQGDPGTKSIVASLYQWSTALPSNPSGTSTYIWATGENTAYTGGGGWTTDVPENSGVPLLQLYTATKTISAAGTAASTTIDWTSGYSIQSVSANGAAGVQSAQPTVYQWAITIPSGPTGTSTYTWSTDTFTPTPSGWTTTPGTSPSAGYTLWGASVNLVASATQTTSTINWTTAGITARGYSGTNGSTGTTGASARICYTKTTLSSLASTPTTITTSGSSSFPPNDSWGTGTIWQATPPTIVAGESVYQSDGIYSPTTGNTVWNVPYLSALKVGSLSAITTNTGNLNVTGTIQASTAAISGTTMTGSGMVVYNTGQFAIGNSTTNITYNGSAITMNGDVVVTGNLHANAATIATNSTIVDNSSTSTTTYFTISGLVGTQTATIQIGIGFVADQNCTIETWLGAVRLSSDAYPANTLAYVGSPSSLTNGTYNASIVAVGLTSVGLRRLSIFVLASKR